MTKRKIVKRCCKTCKRYLYFESGILYMRDPILDETEKVSYLTLEGWVNGKFTATDHFIEYIRDYLQGKGEIQ